MLIHEPLSFFVCFFFCRNLSDTDHFLRSPEFFQFSKTFIRNKSEEEKNVYDKNNGTTVSLSPANNFLNMMHLNVRIIRFLLTTPFASH